MWALFGENVCENERIGSHRGGVRRAHPPRSANAYCFSVGKHSCWEVAQGKFSFEIWFMVLKLLLLNFVVIRSKTRIS